jgi:hypothetical protein
MIALIRAGATPAYPDPPNEASSTSTSATVDEAPRIGTVGNVTGSNNVDYKSPRNSPQRESHLDQFTTNKPTPESPS